MKTEIYTIRDSKTKAFFTPFHTRNEYTAIRSIQECMCDHSHQFARFPHDFDLYYLGDYDDQNGYFDVTEPAHISSLISIRDELAARVPLGDIDHLRRETDDIPFTPEERAERNAKVDEAVRIRMSQEASR